jgi:glycosyltransferase involved in cell wall biosynthesis
VPTVASHVGGVPSLLADGREGLLFPDGDPYALAGKIRYLLDDAASAAEIGKRARDRALCRHDPDAIVADLLRIYDQVR